MEGWASPQHPAASVNRHRTEMTHLIIVHPERFQVVGLCARNHFNVVNLLHSLDLQQGWRLSDGCLSTHTDSEGMSTEARRGPETRPSVLIKFLYAVELEFEHTGVWGRKRRH